MSEASLDQELFEASSGGSRVLTGSHASQEFMLWAFQGTFQNHLVHKF